MKIPAGAPWTSLPIDEVKLSAAIDDLLDERHDWMLRFGIAWMRWPAFYKAQCPKCKKRQNLYRLRAKRWDCMNCPHRFSVTVGTLFEGSHLSLGKWLAGLLIIISTNSADRCVLHKQLGIDYKSVDRMINCFLFPNRLRVTEYATVTVKKKKLRKRTSGRSIFGWGKCFRWFWEVMEQVLGEDTIVYFDQLTRLLYSWKYT